MKPEIVRVVLLEDEGVDYLDFMIEGSSNSYKVNLNSEDSQKEVKRLFSELLRKLIETDLELLLEVDDSYSKNLFKEISEEYIKDLNNEIKQVRQEILNEISPT